VIQSTLLTKIKVISDQGCTDTLFMFSPANGGEENNKKRRNVYNFYWPAYDSFPGIECKNVIANSARV